MIDVHDFLIEQDALIHIKTVSPVIREGETETERKVIAPQIVRYAVLAQTFSVEELHQVPAAVELWERTQRARGAIVLEEPTETFADRMARQSVEAMEAQKSPEEAAASLVRKGIIEPVEGNLAQLRAAQDQALADLSEEELGAALARMASRSQQDGDGR